MATRKETQQRKETLKRSLCQACRSGELMPGDMVPTERALAERHPISRKVTSQVLRELVEEGVLYTIPRVGTFVGRPPATIFEPYLLLSSHNSGELHCRQIQAGFEERIARLGGTSLVMTSDMALEYQGLELPPLAGVFDFAESPASSNPPLTVERKIPHVSFISWVEDREHSDIVGFDDVDGGCQAACHLLSLGHRRIAYLALHKVQDGSAAFAWSAEREQGWRQALAQAGLSTARLAFHPPIEPRHGVPKDQIPVAREAARALIERTDITAVVAANDYAVTGLLEALRAADVPPARWPAIIGFDDMAGARSHILTSLRLPWEELGQAAAELLWQRRHGRLSGPPQVRRVAMRLIPRLTCRPDWSLVSSHAALAMALT